MNLTDRRFLRLGLAATMVSSTILAGAGTSVASTPSVTAKATFGQSRYVSGQTVTVRLRVHNSGTTPAVGIAANQDSGPTALALDQSYFGSLSNGVTIPAGQTVAVTLHGHLGNVTASVVTLSGSLFDRNGDGVAQFSASAPVTVRRTRVLGEVFGDVNSNGRADAGEGLAGVKLTLSYRYGQQIFSATTGRGGRFSVLLPRASYYLSGAHRRWVVIPRPVTVTANRPSLALRAVHPLGKVLKASMRFTRSRYEPRATAHIEVRLKNTGSRVLRGIGAACDRAGDPDELQSKGRGWGALALNRAGVTLPAHGTRTFDVTARVPAAAQRSGVVFVACDFGYPGVDTGYRPTASDWARVPGQRGTLEGDVQYYVHGSSGAMAGLPGVHVVLLDPTRCPLYKRSATTDANGHFRIGGAPASPLYRLYLLTPSGWKVSGQNPTNALVFGKDTTHFFVQVVRGSTHNPTVPTKCQ